MRKRCEYDGSVLMVRQELKRMLRKMGANVTSPERSSASIWSWILARSTDQDPLKTIFDVGGNYGQTACHFAAAFPLATIFTFEPVPAPYQRLVSAVKGCPQIKHFNVALGAEPAVMKMNLCAHSGSNSLSESAAAIGAIDVQVDTVDAMAERHGIDTIDLLKMDVEGFELQVLEGARCMIAGGKVRFAFAECTLANDEEEPHTVSSTGLRPGGGGVLLCNVLCAEL